MWSGSDADYLQLYLVSARAIKGRFPNLKVGGPAVGFSGSFVNGSFQASAFVTNFLAFCRRESLPLDFFSWHCYTADPAELAMRARAIRRLLDARGFNKTESHLNEWNYLPGNSWKPLSKKAVPAAREKFYDEMSGVAGAAFVAAALLELQDAPVDVCNFFHGETSGFGLFTEHGVPTRVYDAMLAFRRLLETPQRVDVRGTVSGQLAAVAGLNESRRVATLLVSNFRHPAAAFAVEAGHLPWAGASVAEIRFIDSTRRLQHESTQINLKQGTGLTLELPSPGVALITLRPAPP
jgi:hypothetical protein